MKILALASTAAFLAAGAASAGTLSYSGYSWNGEDITINDPYSISGGAGQIQLTTPGGTVYAWCLDIADYLAGSRDFNVGGLTTTGSGLPGVPPLTSTQISEIGALMVNGNYLVDNPPSPYTSAEVSAAIQIAIWTIEYENVGSGFTYDALGSPVDAAPPVPSGLVAQYLNDAENVWPDYDHVDVLYFAGNQSLGANQTLITVPEPSTWAMMLIGFAGLGLAGYRGAKAKTVVA